MRPNLTPAASAVTAAAASASAIRCAAARSMPLSICSLLCVFVLPVSILFLRLFLLYPSISFWRARGHHAPGAPAGSPRTARPGVAWRRCPARPRRGRSMARRWAPPAAAAPSPQAATPMPHTSAPKSPPGLQFCGGCLHQRPWGWATGEAPPVGPPPARPLGSWLPPPPPQVRIAGHARTRRWRSRK